MKFILACLAAFVLFAPRSNAAPDTNADAVLGIWHTTGNKGQVRIFKKDNHYCGEILSIARPNFPADDKFGMGGKPRTDRRNPDPKLRDRPVVGIQIMSDFIYSGGDLWKDGTIYDPENGKTYKGKITLKKTGELELRGFVGISMFGRTVIWTR
jgi:uncharacterized protein (DUF2147 family)